MAQIDLAVIGESARWGDYRRACRTRSRTAVHPGRILSRNSLEPRSAHFALNQFKTPACIRAWWPRSSTSMGPTSTAAMSLRARSLSMQGPTGTIWYTLDGTDPRMPGTSPAAAGHGVTLVAEDAAKRVLVPTGPISTAWRGARPSTTPPGSAAPAALATSAARATRRLSRSMSRPRCTDATPPATSGFRSTSRRATLRRLSGLTLKVRYDDGFVAYLNGAEIASEELSVGEPAWNSVATRLHRRCRCG